MNNGEYKVNIWTVNIIPWYNFSMARKQFVLKIEAILVDNMKVQAIREGTSVSSITEKLYTEYLKGKTLEIKPPLIGNAPTN